MSTSSVCDGHDKVAESLSLFDSQERKSMLRLLSPGPKLLFSFVLWSIVFVAAVVAHLVPLDLSTPC